jgi:hypothetical protein
VLLAPGSRAPAPDNRQLATPDAKEQVASNKTKDTNNGTTGNGVNGAEETNGSSSNNSNNASHTSTRKQTKKRPTTNPKNNKHRGLHHGHRTQRQQESRIFGPPSNPSA